MKHFRNALPPHGMANSNETYHLKRKLGFKSAAQPYPSSLKIHTGRPTVCPTMTRVVLSMAKVRGLSRGLIHIHVQRGRGLIVGRIQDTSLHHWLTPYKCFRLWIHAHPAAETIVTLNNADPDSSHYEASGFSERALVVLQ